MAVFCPGIFNSLVWALLILFIGWPIAGFLSLFYIFLMPFAGCIPLLEVSLDGLLNIVWIPFWWGKKCREMAPLSDCALE